MTVKRDRRIEGAVSPSAARADSVGRTDNLSCLSRLARLYNVTTCWTTFGIEDTTRYIMLRARSTDPVPTSTFVPEVSKCPGHSGSHQGLLLARCLLYTCKECPAVATTAIERMRHNAEMANCTNRRRLYVGEPRVRELLLDVDDLIFAESARMAARRSCWREENENVFNGVRVHQLYGRSKQTIRVRNRKVDE